MLYMAIGMAPHFPEQHTSPHHGPCSLARGTPKLCTTAVSVIGRV